MSKDAKSEITVQCSYCRNQHLVDVTELRHKIRDEAFTEFLEAAKTLVGGARGLVSSLFASVLNFPGSRGPGRPGLTPFGVVSGQQEPEKTPKSTRNKRSQKTLLRSLPRKGTKRVRGSGVA